MVILPFCHAAGTPSLGSTTRAISFSGLTQVNSGGHALVVTVTPNDATFPVQTQQRNFRIGKNCYYVHNYQEAEGVCENA